MTQEDTLVTLINLHNCIAGFVPSLLLLQVPAKTLNLGVGHKILHSHFFSMQTGLLFAITTHGATNSAACAQQSVQYSRSVTANFLIVEYFKNTLNVVCNEGRTNVEYCLRKLLNVGIFFCNFCCLNQISGNHFSGGNFPNDQLLHLCHEVLVCEGVQLTQQVVTCLVHGCFHVVQHVKKNLESIE